MTPCFTELTMRTLEDFPNHIKFEGIDAHHGASFYGDDREASAALAAEMLRRWNLWAEFQGDPVAELARLRQVDAQWSAITNSNVQFVSHLREGLS